MHGRIYQWMARTLAVAAVCGASVAARGQEGGAPSGAAPPAPVYAASESNNPGDAGLAARVAELEKALKKMEDKAKADKEKAASVFSCTPYGRAQLDTAMFSQSGQNNYLNAASEPNGVEFRRLYIGMKGAGFDVIEYKAEFDLAGTVTGGTNSYNTFNFPATAKPASIQAKDIYLQVNELPWLGHVRVGNFYEPFSIEDVSGDLVTTFMERGNPYLLVPDRHIGVMAYDHVFGNENALWFAGVFCDAGGDGGMDFQQTNDYTAADATGRLTWLPWYDEATEGRGFLHLGVAGAFREAWGHQFPLPSPSLRPEEAHLARTYAATMNGIDYTEELGTELVFVYGPFSFQSEYIGASSRGLDGDWHNIRSCYAYVSYFLTGENRNYDRNNGTMTRVKPFENFFRVRTCDGDVCTGKGAWEVAYRWSYIDFSDAIPPTSVNANPANRFINHTVGLSWYLNPYTKLMLNDVYSTEQFVAGGNGYLNTVEMRAQIDF
jgi:phosphate-selective porin OprO and OprP